MLNATQLLKTAKLFRDIDPDQVSGLMKDMGREDVRGVLWLVSTGKVDTITVSELQSEIDKNMNRRMRKCSQCGYEIDDSVRQDSELCMNCISDNAIDSCYDKY